MELELTQRCIDEIAHKVAQILARKMKEKAASEEMVTTEEAARILHVSTAHMRRIASRFPHIKQGEQKQGKLLFVRDALLKNY